MARPLRIVIVDGLYHVISRGNARQNVYLEEHDQASFLGTLAHVVDRFGAARYIVLNPIRSGI